MQFQHNEHTAIVTRDFLIQNQLNILPWPSLSQDLNLM